MRDVASSFSLVLLTLISVNILSFSIGFGKVEASSDHQSCFWVNKRSISLPEETAISQYDIQETSYGLFIATNDGKIYRTTDDGRSWDLVFSYPFPAECYIFFKTSQDWLIARWSTTYSGTNMAVSKDGNGTNWQYGDTLLGGFHHCITQHPNGTLYNGLRGHFILRSDNGLNWMQWANATQVIVDLGATPHSPGEDFHAHALAYDCDCNVLYFAGGDTVSGASWAGAGKVIIYYDGTSWHPMEPNRGAGVGCVKTKEGVIFGMDHQARDLPKLWYGNSTYLYFARAMSSKPNGYIGQLDIVNEVVYVATRTFADSKPFGVYASPDYGRNWITLVEETGDNTNIIDYLISDGQESSLLVCRRVGEESAKLWRMYAPSQKEFLHEIKKDDVSTTSTAYTFEKDTGNGTDYVDLSTVSVTDAKIRLTGVSYKNPLSNPSFEDGESGWILSGDGTHGTVTHQKKYGDYSLNVNKSGSGTRFMMWQDWFDVKNNERYLVSLWVRTNVTAGGYLIYIRYLQKNTTGQTTRYQHYVHSSPYEETWECRSSIITTNELPKVCQLFVRFEIFAKTGVNIAWYVDGLMVEHINRARPDKQHDPYNPSELFEGTLNTTDVSMEIAGTTVEYSGELSNGTETIETSLPNLRTGIVPISYIQVSGSGIVKITIEAAIEFTLTNVVLREKAGQVYIGRRYNDSITVPTTISSMICISDGRSNITIGSVSDDKMTLTISAWNSLTTSTKVYCGNKGTPKAVYGADMWGYVSSTKICTITVTHSSEESVTLDWSTPVGGIIVPVDRLALMAPYIAQAIAVIALIAGTAYVRKQ